MFDDLKVSSLIDHSSKKWNGELVRICFRPADAECILNIALSHNQVPDCVSWPLTKTGNCTVKSAYLLAKTEKVHLKATATGKGESSDQLCIVKEWKRLWSIKAPPKMKIVLWRFAHNCLPTEQQLKLRNIPAYNLCCHCGRDEFVEHAFLTCQRQWIFETLADCSEREASIFVISLWHIWEARNAVRNGESEMHPHCIVEKLIAYVDMVLLHLYNPVVPNRCDSQSLNVGIHHLGDGLW